MPEILDKATIKALGAEARQEMVKLLAKRPYTASELSKLLGRHVTTVSEHLGVLEKSGLVARKESGNKWIYYELTAKGEKLFKPSYYSWVIVFSLSLLSLFAGAYRILNIFGASYSQQAMETAQKAAEGAPKAAVDAGASLLTADLLLGAVFVFLGIAGFGYLIAKHKKMI